MSNTDDTSRDTATMADCIGALDLQRAYRKRVKKKRKQKGNSIVKGRTKRRISVSHTRRR